MVESLNTLPGVGGTAAGANLNSAVFPGSDFVPLPVSGTAKEKKGLGAGMFAVANGDDFKLEVSVPWAFAPPLGTPNGAAEPRAAAAVGSGWP